LLERVPRQRNALEMHRDFRWALGQNCLKAGESLSYQEVRAEVIFTFTYVFMTLTGKFGG
jgi:hypothetical protein